MSAETVDGFVKRCAKPAPHEQHEWVELVERPSAAEIFGAEALMWAEPHLCLGHERIIAFDIVDDQEQPGYEPSSASAAAELGGTETDKPLWTARHAWSDDTPYARHARGYAGRQRPMVVPLLILSWVIAAGVAGAILAPILLGGR